LTNADYKRNWNPWKCALYTPHYIYFNIFPFFSMFIRFHKSFSMMVLKVKQTPNITFFLSFKHLEIHHLSTFYKLFGICGRCLPKFSLKKYTLTINSWKSSWTSTFKLETSLNVFHDAKLCFIRNNAIQDTYLQLLQLYRLRKATLRWLWRQF
jgi:hypothetical protein